MQALPWAAFPWTEWEQVYIANNDEPNYKTIASTDHGYEARKLIFLNAVVIATSSRDLLVDMADSATSGEATKDESLLSEGKLEPKFIYVTLTERTVHSN